MRHSLIIILFWIVNTAVFAAGPVTHVVLAQKWMEHRENFNEEEKRAFILGNLFPDIRYLRVITRAETHEKGLTLEKIQASETSFIKGMRLHAWIDVTRERLIRKWGIYQKIKDQVEKKHMATFLKLVEDEILFQERSWISVRHYLTLIHPEEREFRISEENLRKWHQYQTLAFTLPPSLYLLGTFKRGYGNAPPEIIDQWITEIPKFANDDTMKEYVHNLVEEFDKLFSEAN